MKVLLVDDNVTPFPVEPSNGTTPIQCTPGTVPGGSSPIVLVGGNQTEAPTNCDPASTETIFTDSIDTTGLGIGACALTTTFSVELAAAATATAWFTVTLDGNPLSPALGAIVSAPTTGGSIIATVAFQGTFALSEGAHTLVTTVSTDANTTATVNPAITEEATIRFSATERLYFLAA